MEWLLVKIPVIDVPALFAVGLVGLWLLLRTRQTHLDPAVGLAGMLGRGEPTVLEFFGNL